MITNKHLMFCEKLSSVLIFNNVQITGLTITSSYTIVNVKHTDGVNIVIEDSAQISNSEILNCSDEFLTQRTATQIIETIQKVKNTIQNKL